MAEQNWIGAGVHGFTGVPDLLISIGNLDRFLKPKECLCILMNANIFADQEIFLDAQGDGNRKDYDFVVVNRPTFLQMGVEAEMVAPNLWPGYKRINQDELSEERRISTLKRPGTFKKKDLFRPGQWSICRRGTCILYLAVLQIASDKKNYKDPNIERKSSTGTLLVNS